MKNFLRDGSPRGRIAGGHCNANPTARDRDRAKLSPKTFSYTENISRHYVFSQGQRRQKQTCVQKLEHSMTISIAENKRGEIDLLVVNGGGWHGKSVNSMINETTASIRATELSTCNKTPVRRSKVESLLPRCRLLVIGYPPKYYRLCFNIQRTKKCSLVAERAVLPGLSSQCSL